MNQTTSTSGHSALGPTTTAYTSEERQPASLQFLNNTYLVQYLCALLWVPPAPRSSNTYTVTSNDPRSYTESDSDMDLQREVMRSRHDLFNLALASKAYLLEPALNSLWRDIGTLFPLLKILPAFFQSEGTWILRGKILPAHWERYMYYARRVRNFTYARDPDALDIALHVYFRLAQLCPRDVPQGNVLQESWSFDREAGYVLPALQHLDCPSTSQQDFLISGICLFLSPSLRSINLGVISSVEDKLNGTILHTLAAEGAKMESIRLRGVGLGQNTLGKLLAWPDTLRELEVRGMGPGLTSSWVQKVGRMKMLQKLTLDLRESVVLDELLAEGTSGTGSNTSGSSAHYTTTDEDTRRSNSNDAEFSSLTKLSLTAPIWFIRQFVSERVASSTLEDLSCFCAPYYIPTPEDSTTRSSSLPQVSLKDLVKENIPRYSSTLLRFELVHLASVPSGTESPPESPVITLTDLEPLLSIHGLRHLRIEGYSMDLPDETIRRFVSSWPLLEELSLPYSLPPTATIGGDLSPNEKPSFLALQALAKDCKFLTRLRLPLDLQGFMSSQRGLLSSFPLSSATSSASKHPLVQLTISTSDDERWEVREVLAVAKALESLFPNLDAVDGWSPYGPLDDDRWFSVREAVRMLRLVRAEEYRRR